MFHFSYPPSKLENVDYSLFKQGARPQGFLRESKVLNSRRQVASAAHVSCNSGVAPAWEVGIRSSCEFMGHEKYENRPQEFEGEQFGGTIWLFNIAMENHHF